MGAIAEKDGATGSKKFKQEKVILLLSVLLIVVCSAWFSFIAYRAFRQWTSSKWPTAKGRIAEVSYQEYATRRSGERGAAVLTVQYEYEVRGQTYQSDKIAVGVNRYKREAEHVSGLTNEYRTGAEVNVFYNPIDPEQAVLRSEVNLIDKLTLGVLGILIGFIAYNLKPKPK